MNGPGPVEGVLSSLSLSTRRSMCVNPRRLVETTAPTGSGSSTSTRRHSNYGRTTVRYGSGRSRSSSWPCWWRARANSSPARRSSKRCGGSDTFVDYEQGVNHSIKELRAALGDSSGSPRFIETLPRRGYRFIAPVEKCAPVANRRPDACRSNRGPASAGATSSDFARRDRAASPAPVHGDAVERPRCARECGRLGSDQDLVWRRHVR